MIDDIIPFDLLHLLFGIKNHDSPAAKETEVKYMDKLLNIFLKAMDEYMKQYPDDKEFIEAMKPVVMGESQDKSGIASLSKIKAKPAWETFLNTVLDRINNYNAVIIDVQLINLGTEELADIFDYLNLEKEEMQYNPEELRKRLELEIPERMRNIQGFGVPLVQKPDEAPKVTQPTLAEPNAPVLDALEQLKQLVTNQQPASPVAIPTPAAQPVPATETGSGEVNIVDQTAPSDRMLEKQFSPQIHLGGVKGPQPINTPK